MNKWSSLLLTLIENSAGDYGKDILAYVFVSLTAALPSKADFIAPISLSDAAELIEKFDNDELKGWRREVKEAIGKSNWERLALHRTF